MNCVGNTDITVNLAPPSDKPDFWKDYTISLSDEGRDMSEQKNFLVTNIKNRKTWLLVRNKVNPSALFPIGDSNSLKLRGFSWFKETVTVTLPPVPYAKTITVTPSH